MTRSNHSRRREAREYMARHGTTYTQALRALETAAQHTAHVQQAFQVIPADQGGPRVPAVTTREHDVNPVCGHWQGHKCDSCATCTICDGCYCDELRQEAQEDACFDRQTRDHEDHRAEPGEDCAICDDNRERTKDYTECPTCHKALKGFWHFKEHCPPYCLTDKPHPPGLDWSHLAGRRVTIDTHWCYQGKMAGYAASWTGTVIGRWRNPDTGAVTDLYEMHLDPNVPQPNDHDLTPIQFDPREFTITEH
ncbi:hypothetical protein [Nocardia acidivorans]|uniref:hypothetical protein n=1 Tax=Nocardia acidivorans TaxID=404580 RepID=UPI000A9CDC8A|nr:hypothetical protein [Nocardia acidivorans]